ncbi:MAG: hypothetical protein AB1796_00780 [Bacillota bacterium]
MLDELGNLYDAIARASQLAGIEGEPRVYHYGIRQFWGLRIPGLQLDLTGFLPLPGRNGLFLR